ncbi:FdrA family protein [Phytoactinopolyspora alkaliphila]|uniref:FdrA family protein n=1 Tax=Phytoactinopolyspora alkaliphila TaxID=1783498 RepID=A0A6N9YGC2_9ACTN|nr:FdrA family protein [Phytoactinopolyspora alkaliphila]NED93958.1 FdrA family protein [Phytoactinopolyspora alkaliphila]
MTRILDIRAGVYHDSVSLMQVSASVQKETGVRSALVAMATGLNLDVLTGMGFAEPESAGPNDLLIAIDADDDDAIGRARAAVDAALNARAQAPASGFGDAPAPRTVGSAARRSPVTIAFISTPGQHAFTEAMDAVDHDLPVIVFSDNVPLEREIQLKLAAGRRGTLVMGPDCGTAVLGGVGFGFANVVRPGPVGIVAASGTGAQHLMSLLDGAGVGISHCLGVGGRDMADDVGGISTLTSMDLLAADHATEQIVVVGKPPAPRVAEEIRAHASRLGKPVRFALLGEAQPDLTAAARLVVEALGGTWAEPRSWAPPTGPATMPAGGHLRGLFSGGTLCDEAMIIAAEALGPVRSNIPLRPEWALPTDLRTDGHAMIDFGDDALTQGRAHPMIDGSLRAERILAEAADASCGVLMLDVVLGHGAHPDPAAELAPAIEQARHRARAEKRELAVLVSLVGTAADPQGLDQQAERLAEAGAAVHLSNAAAARHAVSLLKEGHDTAQ